jgi:hypothetical protein
VRYSATHFVAPLHVQALSGDASLAESVAGQILALKVVIIWMEQRGFETKHFLSDKTRVLIIIRPTENPNYLKIAIEKRDQPLKFGLIDDELTVSRRMASVVVRWTSLFAYDAVRSAERSSSASDIISRVPRLSCK